MKQIEHLTEPEIKELTGAMSVAVRHAAKFVGVEEPLFALLVFNDPIVVHYVSNCRREDVAKRLRKMADRLESCEDEAF